MAGKDVRNYRYGGGRARGRKGSHQWSQQSWEMPQVSGTEEAVVPGLINSSTDASRNLWDGAQVDGAKVDTHTPDEVLARLPTPSRAPEPAFAEQPMQEEDLRFSQGHERAGAGSREQWHMQKPEEEQRHMSPSQPQPSYREWLQARGQQAMQRTITGGSAAMSPAASVASPTASPHNGQILSSLPPGQAALPALPPLPLSAPASDPMVSWGHVQPPLRQPPLQQQLQQPPMQQPPLQQPWCPTPGLDMQYAPTGHMGPYPQPVQAPALPPAALAHVPPLEEACGQQSPMMSMMSPCGMAPSMNGDMMCGQLTPSTAAPSPLAPPAAQMAISHPGLERWSQEEVVAQLMPGILGMDKQQLAQQLRDAAECVYDD
eukprot:TRINITY_DN63253_c0_g1_i1.p1 TRINITY_DN63253_c0_g1~~TRINITY_DN63253_c0_g1_i1.p1  ORF type:complete len:374 (-),score=99.50 TRINITY_DN63253_c0_g1_i1:212-1333(-)